MRDVYILCEIRGLLSINSFGVDYFEVFGLFHFHYMKSARIRSFSGPYFPVFGLNTERYSVSLHIQFECGKIWSRKTPNTDTFYTVFSLKVLKNLREEPSNNANNV